MLRLILLYAQVAEKSLANVYRLYARRFDPGSAERALLESLEREERGHQAALARLEDALGEDAGDAMVGEAKRALLEHQTRVTNDALDLMTDVQDPDADERELAERAVRLEESLIENVFGYMRFTAGSELHTMAHEMAEESRSHAERLRAAMLG